MSSIADGIRIRTIGMDHRLRYFSRRKSEEPSKRSLEEILKEAVENTSKQEVPAKE